MTTSTLTDKISNTGQILADMGEPPDDPHFTNPIEFGSLMIAIVMNKTITKPPSGCHPSLGSTQIVLILITLLLLCSGSYMKCYAAPPEQTKWKPLPQDKLHEPSNPALEELQEPAEALSGLPQDSAGNQVNWVKALREGFINPRTNIDPEFIVQVIDMDIIMGNTAGIGMVRFPHKAHTEWLDCVNCHDELFIPEVDANPINMFAVLQGEFCGRCHGAVAFPLTECDRCHSVARNLYRGTLGAQYDKISKEEALKMLKTSRAQSRLKPIQTEPQ